MMVRFLPSLLPFIGVILIAINAVDGMLNSACGQTNFTADTGTVAFAAQSSSRTLAKSECTYVIRTKKDTRIVLKWKRFSVDSDMPQCRTSSVTIYLGCSSTKLIDFCSKNTDSLPHDIYTRDNCLKLVFNSNQATKEEFSATYYTADKNKPVSSKSSYCYSLLYKEKELDEKSGVIISPGWPTGYDQLWNDCKWNIEMPLHYLIKFTFMDIDIYKSFLGCEFGKERLKLKGEKSVLTTFESKDYYCGKYSPFTLTTRYYELELVFQTSGWQSRQNRGFVVGYIAYKTSESVSAADTRKKIEYIVIPIVAVLAIGGAAYYFWRRRNR